MSARSQLVLWVVRGLLDSDNSSTLQIWNKRRHFRRVVVRIFLVITSTSLSSKTEIAHDNSDWKDHWTAVGWYVIYIVFRDTTAVFCQAILGTRRPIGATTVGTPGRLCCHRQYTYAGRGHYNFLKISLL